MPLFCRRPRRRTPPPPPPEPSPPPPRVDDDGHHGTLPSRPVDERAATPMAATTANPTVVDGAPTTGDVRRRRRARRTRARGRHRRRVRQGGAARGERHVGGRRRVGGEAREAASMASTRYPGVVLPPALPFFFDAGASAARGGKNCRRPGLTCAGARERATRRRTTTPESRPSRRRRGHVGPAASRPRRDRRGGGRPHGASG